MPQRLLVLVERILVNFSLKGNPRSIFYAAYYASVAQSNTL